MSTGYVWLLPQLTMRLLLLGCYELALSCTDCEALSIAWLSTALLRAYSNDYKLFLATMKRVIAFTNKSL